jgi:hypothetical protein
MATNVFSGPRARLKANGEVIGYTGGVSGGEQIDYEPIETIDFLEVREHIPVAYRVTLSMSFFRIIGQSLKARGLFPTLENILTSGALTISVEDSQTGNTPMLFEQVRIASKNFDIGPRGIVSDSTDAVCIRCRDEYERPIGG